MFGIIDQIIFYIFSLILAVFPTTQYIEGVTGQPTSFLPHQASSQMDKTISSLIFRGLFKYDNYGVLIPDLADTWTVSSNGTVYTIKLKSNQRWADGKKITSDDLIYTSFKVADLSGVETDKIDDLTVRYTLPNKFSPFLSLLTVGVMPANAEDLYDPLVPVSSGPFRVIRIEKSGPIVKQVVLYNYGINKNIRKLVFRYYSNESELETAAKLGEIDAFISTKQPKLENFNEYRYPIQGVYYALFFNLRDAKLKDEKLRQKIGSVLPIEDMIRDYGIFVQGPISRSVFTDQNIELYKYNDKFVDNLAGTEITITIPDIQQHKKLADDIKRILEDKLNLKVNITTVDPALINDQVIKDRNFEILLYGQEIGRDPDRYVNWHSTQKDAPGLNLSGFSHVRADRALEEGRNEVDNDKRVVHYNEFQKVITDQVPAIFLYHPYFKYYVNEKVAGVGDKYTFTLADRFLDFPNWRVLSN